LPKKIHLETDKVSLLSAVAPALKKETPFVECLQVHSAKGLAKRLAKRPTGAFFAEG
jgi:hypothetical protein